LTAKGTGLVEELIPIAVHFEEVAVRDLPTKGLSELKSTLEAIYVSLGSIEPEIAEVNAQRPAARRSLHRT
jgi:hypothetical protein